MRRTFLCLCALFGVCFSLGGAVITLEHSNAALNGPNRIFQPELIGAGPPAQWNVLTDSMPSAMTQISPLAPKANRKNVIGQLSQIPAEHRFPMLLYAKESFEGFQLSVRLKILEGEQAQSAGVLFRWQNPQNYYSVRIDALGGWFLFRKTVNGQEQEPIGNRCKIQPRQWHTLHIQCEGPKISLRLNDEETIPTIIDTQFSSGKIGYFTQADTTAYFADAKITYRPQIIAAQRIINQVMKKYSRLLQISLYAKRNENSLTTVIAGNQKERIGQAADEAVLDSILRRNIYFAKTRKTIILTLPVKDRNGEGMAACRIELKSFPGQTRQNAVARCLPIIQMIQAQALNREDLFQ